MAVASPISAFCTCLCSSSSTCTRSRLLTASSLHSYPKVSKFHLSPWFSQLGSSHFSPYTGLKYLGISISPKSIKSERKKRFKRMVVHASLFGVGAPEALVIGVVALLVFGPKGLAEVARNLGKTLRAFQPTIRELQDVSREFKSTLEREIGLDDISTPNTYGSNRFNNSDPNGAPSPKPYPSGDHSRIPEEQLKGSGDRQSETQNEPQEQPNVSAALTTPGENQYKPPTQSEGTDSESAATTSPGQVTKHQM